MSNYNGYPIPSLRNCTRLLYKSRERTDGYVGGVKKGGARGTKSV